MTLHRGGPSGKERTLSKGVRDGEERREGREYGCLIVRYKFFEKTSII